VQALADHRRYLFARPFTLAVRGFHFGRYGPDAEGTEDGQRIFNDMDLGQPSLVRGYLNAFSRCRDEGRSCDVLNQGAERRSGEGVLRLLPMNDEMMIPCDHVIAQL
jgi:hypothetical protein